MLGNLEPNRKRSKAGSLSAKEKKFCKALSLKGYVVQDIAFIINQGREKTVNQSVVQLSIKDKEVKKASDEEVKQFLKIQSSYDPVTLLNPYKDGRLIKAREAMIAAVQAFNNPAIIFRTEVFCVLANIAWTYLLHEKMEQTKKGSSKLKNGNSITVSGTLSKKICPIENEAVKENLKKIIQIRDAVEHNIFLGGEECFGLLFQACCINFENLITGWFGERLTLSKDLSLALQFVRITNEQVVQIESTNFPKEIAAIQKEIQDSKFSDDCAFQLNVHFTTEVTNKTNAELHKLVSYEANQQNEKVVIKKQKVILLSQKEVVEKLNKFGFPDFDGYQHMCFWQTKWADAKIRNKEAKKYGETIYKSQWLWYEHSWLPEVIKYCKEQNKEKEQ